MASYELIKTESASLTGVSSISFSSIPQNYNNLKVIVNSRSSGTGTYANIGMTANGAANNSSAGQALVLYTTTSANTVSYTNVGSFPFIGDLNAGQNYANTFGTAEITIGGYSRTTPTYKPYMSDSMNISDNPSSNYYPELNGGYLICSAPITQLTFWLGTGVWISGSYISLYGLKSV
jgi:hypothetical protein